MEREEIALHFLSEFFHESWAQKEWISQNDWCSDNKEDRKALSSKTCVCSFSLQCCAWPSLAWVQLLQGVAPEYKVLSFVGFCWFLDAFYFPCLLELILFLASIILKAFEGSVLIEGFSLSVLPFKSMVWCQGAQVSLGGDTAGQGCPHLLQQLSLCTQQEAFKAWI